MSEQELNGKPREEFVLKSENQDGLDVYLKFFKPKTPNDPEMEIMLPKEDVPDFIATALSDEPLTLSTPEGYVVISKELYYGLSMEVRPATKKDLERGNK